MFAAAAVDEQVARATSPPPDSEFGILHCGLWLESPDPTNGFLWALGYCHYGLSGLGLECVFFGHETAPNRLHLKLDLKEK